MDKLFEALSTIATIAAGVALGVLLAVWIVMAIGVNVDGVCLVRLNRIPKGKFTYREG